MKKLKVFIKYTESRKLLLLKNVSGLFIAKAIGLICSIILVPMILSYLNPDKYGIWITLSSILGWFAILDFGLVNGLRNSMGSAIANKDFELARSLVSTVLMLLIAIASIFIILVIIINGYVDWTLIFNSTKEMNEELTITVLIVLTAFAFRFVLGLANTVLMIFHRSAIAEFANATISVLSVIFVYILPYISENSLVILSLGLSLSSVFVMTVLTYWVFKRKYVEIKPKVSYVNLNLVNALGKQGIQFFIIQISGLILFTTDNLIIAQLFDPKEVAIYSLPFKLFSIITIGFGVLVTPLWSLLTESFAKNDIEWVKEVTKKLIYCWLITSIVALVMLNFAFEIYNIWVGEKLRVPTVLSILICLYVIVHTFISIFMTIIFSHGNIKIQMYLAIFAAVLNIPLSVLFAKGLSIGPAGVILATICCISPNIFIAPIQYMKIIKGRSLTQ